MTKRGKEQYSEKKQIALARSVANLNEYKLKQVADNKHKILRVLGDGNFTKLEILDRVAMSESTLERYLKTMSDAGEIIKSNLTPKEYIYGLPGAIFEPVRPSKRIRNRTEEKLRGKRTNKTYEVLEFVKNNEGCTSIDVQKAIGIKSAQSVRYLKKLADLKLICKVKFNQNQQNIVKYYLVKEGVYSRDDYKRAIVAILNNERTHYTMGQLNKRMKLPIENLQTYVRELVDENKIKMKKFSCRVCFYSSLEYDLESVPKPVPIRHRKVKKGKIAKVNNCTKPVKVKTTKPIKVKQPKTPRHSIPPVMTDKRFKVSSQHSKKAIDNIIQIIKNFGGSITSSQLFAAPGVDQYIIDYMLYNDEKQYLIVDRSTRPVVYKLAGGL